MKTGPTSNERDIANALQELRVHQLELEEQNRELRESREALEASRSRYADLFDFAPIGYMCLDRSGRIVELNLTGAKLLGHDRLTILGKPLRAVVRSDVSREISDHVRQCLTSRDTVRAEIGFVRKADGAHVQVQAVSAPIIGPQGTSLGSRTALIDVTERHVIEREREAALEREQKARHGLEQARAHAEQANRLKDEFLSVVSHELRTPLNAILGWSHMLTSLPFDCGRIQHGLAVIRRNAETQQRLVEDILDVSRIITGKLRVDLKPAVLHEVVRSAVDTMQATAWAKRVRLTLDVTSDAPISADVTRLQQAIVNLLSNAIKFTPADGQVSVIVQERGDAGLVTVHDTGIGIDSASLPWIFDRFRQVDTSSSRQFCGLGLGLAIARHIIDLHGGRVWGASDGIGRGATFAIELPRATSSARDSNPTSTLETATGTAPAPLIDQTRLAGVRVLVVDDNEDARLLAATLLETNGATVVVAESAAEGLATVAREAPDVILSDLAMPGQDGLSFVAKLRTLPPPWGQIPAVAITACARAEDADAAMAAGYDDFLSKPVAPSTLVSTITRMARSAPKRERTLGSER